VSLADVLAGDFNGEAPVPLFVELSDLF